MNTLNQKTIVGLFHFVCWTATIGIIFYWIYLFSLNRDLTVMDYKPYYHDESARPPMLSLCFKNPFNNTKLAEINPKVNATSYLAFLEGIYFSEEMLQYDYQSIIFNISDYVIGYRTYWKNMSKTFNDPKNGRTDVFRSTFSGFWFKKFFNCYGLQMPHSQDVISRMVHLKSDIFPSKIRPWSYDFLTIVHFPNHLMISLENIQYSWAHRRANDSYKMAFSIRNVEVFKHRNKNHRPCNENWKDHDDNMRINISKIIGCKTPYYPTHINTKLCLTGEDMKRAKLELTRDEGENIRSCRTMDNIRYTYEESDYFSEWNGTFWISFNIRSNQFREIIQVR